MNLDSDIKTQLIENTQSQLEETVLNGNINAGLAPSLYHIGKMMRN